RLLLSDFILNVARSFPRRQTDLRAHTSCFKDVALHLSQSWRGNDAGGLDEWPALYRTADCVSVSKGHEPGMQLPPSRRKLVAGAQSHWTRRHGRSRGRRCDRTEFKAAIAA